MDRDQAKAEAKSRIEEYLRGKGINTRKPFTCLNPEHPDAHPSMSYNPKAYNCKCFSCGASYDIFDLVGIDYGLTDAKSIFDKTYELLNIQVDKAEKEERIAKKPDNKPSDIEDYILWAQKRIESPSAEAYLTKRGISIDTAKKYGLGYDDNLKTFNEDDNGKTEFVTWRALIIPTAQNSYCARNLDRTAQAEHKNRYRKKGASKIFNIKALYEADKPIFIVEGEIDALSIIEAQGYAIGLGAVTNTDQLLRTIKEKAPTQPLVLCLDKDDAGQNRQKQLVEELTDLKIPFYTQDISGDFKDANEALINDREAFITTIRQAETAQEDAIKDAQEAIRREYLQTSAGANVDAFLRDIEANKDKPIISTGFSGLDRILCGGLFPGLYILGAISSLGKSTFLLQVADNLAQAGYDVIYISLEMTRKSLMSKSISRETFMLSDDKRIAKTAREITTGIYYDKYTAEEKALINRAVNRYKEYANNIFIYEAEDDLGIGKMRDIVERHIAITDRKPIVILDYFQLLEAEERKTDKQNADANVKGLSHIARDFNVPVIAISSFNRDSYKNDGGAKRGKVSMTDFKESGNLEYTADVLIGLEFASAGTDDYTEEKAKSEYPRHIRAVILKDREGETFTSASFEYNPAYNLFTDTIDAEPVPDIFAELRGKNTK